MRLRIKYRFKVFRLGPNSWMIKSWHSHTSLLYLNNWQESSLKTELISLLPRASKPKMPAPLLDHGYRSAGLASFYLGLPPQGEVPGRAGEEAGPPNLGPLLKSKSQETKTSQATDGWYLCGCWDKLGKQVADDSRKPSVQKKNICDLKRREKGRKQNPNVSFLRKRGLSQVFASVLFTAWKCIYVFIHSFPRSLIHSLCSALSAIRVSLSWCYALLSQLILLRGLPCGCTCGRLWDSLLGALPTSGLSSLAS